MSEDLVTLHMLVVSNSASDRDLWRRGAVLGSVPIDFIETASAAVARDVLKRGGVDVLVVDLGFGGGGELVTIARDMAPGPFIVSILRRGPRPVRHPGSDAAVVQPLSGEDARIAVERCARGRLATRVMIVDDSATTRSIVRKILGASRYTLTVSEEAEGISALRKVKNGSVDMVFLDYHLPGLNGVETLSEIKRETPRVAVVMMTSTLDSAVVERATKAGATAFLQKPFFPQDVDRVLGLHHGLRSAGN